MGRRAGFCEVGAACGRWAGVRVVRGCGNLAGRVWAACVRACVRALRVGMRCAGGRRAVARRDARASVAMGSKVGPVSLLASKETNGTTFFLRDCLAPTSFEGALIQGILVTCFACLT